MSRSDYNIKTTHIEQREVDIKRYLSVIVRHKWIILLSLLCTIAGSLVYLNRAVPLYETSVKILTGEERGEFSLFREIDFLGQAKLAEELETYCELLRTHQIARRVVENLKLHEPAAETDENISGSLLSKIRRLIHLGGSANTDQTEQQVRRDDEELRIRNATEHLQSMIKVSPIKSTRVIKVTVTGTDPDKIARIANELARVFIEYDLQSMIGEAKGAHTFISEQLKIVEEKLRKTEEELKAFKEKESVVELSQEAKITLERLSAIETSYSNTITRRQEAEARLKNIRKELGRQSETVRSSETIVQNPLLQQLKGQLYNLEIELAGLLRIYSESTPEVQQVKTKIKEIKARLADEVERIVTNETSTINPVHQTLVGRLIELEADVIAYGAMAEAQKTFVEKYRSELEKLPYKELQLARLIRDKNVSDQIYMMLMQRNEEAQLAQAIQIGNMSIADPAIKPLYPYSPNRKLYLMMGFMTGLMLGFGLAFLLEYMDNTFKTEEEVKRYLELPFLGGLPFIRAKRVSRSLPNSSKDLAVGDQKAVKSNQELRMLTHVSPKAPEAETYRILITNIQFSEVDGPIRTLMITSSNPGEGKTITATNLSIAMAQGGKRILLVDTDMRKPMIHRLFQQYREPGLTELLLGKADVQDVIRSTEVNNLYIITAGTSPPNAPQLLASPKMDDLIDELKRTFEIIIFDTPPATVVTDPAILASKVDAACLVVEAERTNREAALKAKELLLTVNAKLLGVILNKIDITKGYGVYNYNYYYYYYDDRRENANKVRRKRRKRKR